MTTSLAPRAPVAPGTDAVPRRQISGVLAWTVVVLAAVLWGPLAAGGDVGIGAPPFVGRWEWDLRLGLVPAILLGALVAWKGPAAVASLRWSFVPVATAVVASLWGLLLAASEGWAAVTAPLTTRFEYEPFAAGIGGPSEFAVFWSGYVEHIGEYPTHVRGHPPGAVAVPWLLDQVGLGGAGWFAVLCLAGWGVAVGAALVAYRAVAGEAAARSAAPVLALLPAAIWAGTSADALFAGVIALGVALTVVAAVTGRHAWLAGATLGAALLLTYGAVPVLVLPAAVIVHRRAWRAGTTVVVAAVGVLSVAALAGFSWPEGLAATRAEYWQGLAADRPGWYLMLAGNPGALALALGPAVAAGLARLRWPARRSLLPMAAAAAVVAANLSQLSRGEVERIWLLFVPWLALAAAGGRRRWLVAQVAVAVVIQTVLRSPW